VNLGQRSAQSDLLEGCAAQRFCVSDLFVTVVTTTSRLRFGEQHQDAGFEDTIAALANELTKLLCISRRYRER
jgi:hypothetical protein